MVDFRTLAGRLFKLVFGWYLILATLVTALQLGLEYSAIRRTIKADLVALGNSFSPAVSDALWTYDQPLLDSLAKGMAQAAIVTGIKIENCRGDTIASAGHLPRDDGNAANGSFLGPYQRHELTLQTMALAESHGAHPLGRMVLYSDREVVLERVEYSFWVILINSLVKTTGLWLIFHWAITWRLSRPLTELAVAVARLNLKEGEDKPVLLDYPQKDEVGLLVTALNDMRLRLSDAQRELEDKVATRTRELEEANRRLATLSTTDGLTGIANRRHFDAALASEWNRALRAGQPLALLMLDVDLFKPYNDHYGHQVGDDCLRRVAETLHGASRRAGDLAARYGGEEFALIAADTDVDQALSLAETVRADIEALDLPHARSPFSRLTVSIGVAAVVPDETRQPEWLVLKADEALYLAKNQGRNRVVLASNQPLP